MVLILWGQNKKKIEELSVEMCGNLIRKRKRGSGR
jgi:hypothetical protein